MPRGIPKNPGRAQRRPRIAQNEFERRNEAVKIMVTLDRGQLEDLEALSRVRHGPRSRAALIREAVGWLIVREAAQIVRGERVDKRRAVLAEREADAIAFSREERDQFDQARELDTALAIARGETTELEPNPDPLAAMAAQVEEMKAKIDALRAAS